MAKRHSTYARLLGTVENDPKPLVKRVDEQMTANVPHLHDMASDCYNMSDKLKRHGDKLKLMGDMQPNFRDQFSNIQEDVGLPDVGY